MFWEEQTQWRERLGLAQAHFWKARTPLLYSLSLSPLSFFSFLFLSVNAALSPSAFWVGRPVMEGKVLAGSWRRGNGSGGVRGPPAWRGAWCGSSLHRVLPPQQFPQALWGGLSCGSFWQSQMWLVVKSLDWFPGACWKSRLPVKNRINWLSTKIIFSLIVKNSAQERSSTPLIFLTLLQSPLEW